MATIKTTRPKNILKYPGPLQCHQEDQFEWHGFHSQKPRREIILPNDISGITTDDHGDIIYAAYGFARFIGKIDVTTGSISSIAGQPYKREWCPVYTQGESSKAEFVSPETIIASKKGEIIFTDQRLHRVIKVANGQVSTLAGNSIIDPCAKTSGAEHRKVIKTGKH